MSSGSGSSNGSYTGPNASIWPIQLSDNEIGPSSSASVATTSRKRFTYVQVERIDFEDVSFFLNFDLLFCELEGHSTTSSKNDTVKLAKVEPGAKRNRSVSIESQSGVDVKKRRKDGAAAVGDVEKAELINTSCMFRVSAREAHDTDTLLKLKQLLQSGSSSEQLRLNDLEIFANRFPTSRSEDSVISNNIIWLRHPSTKQWIASLPVLSAHAPPDHNSTLGRLTNGEWLVSLANLVARDSITATVSLTLATPPAGFPADRVTAGFLFIQLSVRVQVDISTTAAGGLASDRIVDMASIVRFADSMPADSDDTAKNQEVDAGFVYRNLRPASLNPPDAIQPADLFPTLLPFQKRSTAFVLGREGKVIDAKGNVVDTKQIMGHDGPSDLGLWWKQVGDRLYYNWIEARFVRDPSLTLLSDFKGAMLAEEMGLGKTVEAVALMLLNPDPEAASRPGWYDERNEIDVVPTKTTLIVAPETLRAQWVEEIGRHAPSLDVYSYRSRTKAEEDVPKGLTWEQWARQIDVMILSYSTLAKELSTAKSAPARSRRHERKYERPRSPLVKLHFHRVLMDEVQMIGASSAAETVSMISRSSSIAVSGTPVKKMDDLKSCFRFLRVPGYAANASQWQSILHPLLAPALFRVLRTIGTRHTKTQVASEMSLPVQARSVIPIDFTSIEAAFYADVWKDALSATGYKTDGDPQTPDHSIDVQKMRHHLLLLRQACTHPQVALQFRGGVVGSKNLRSIDEVLELMIDSTRSELHSSRTHWFDRRIHRNILTLYRRKEDQRILAASQLSDIEAEINKDVVGLEQEIRDAATSGPFYRFSEHELDLEQKAEVRQRRLGFDNPEARHDENGDLVLQSLVRDPEAYQALLAKRRARAEHVTQLKAHLRFLLMKLHRLLQFAGNLYYQRGEYLDEREKANGQYRPDDSLTEVAAEPNPPIKTEADAKVLTEVPLTKSARTESGPVTQGEDAEQKASLTTSTEERLIMSPQRQSLKDQEDAAYSKAEKVRQRLLVEAGAEVQAAVARLKRSQLPLDPKEVHFSKALFELGVGILSSDSYERLIENVDLLNEHAEILFRWRESIITRLVRPVNRDVSLEREDDDQYQDNLNTQAEAEVLLDMYRPLLAEREKILKGNVAIGSTDRPILFKEVEAAVKLARQNDLRGIPPESEADQELVRVYQQQLAHFKKLDGERRSVSLAHHSQSFSNVAEDLRGLRDTTYGAEEAALAKQAHIETRRIILEQIKHLEKLRNEEKALFSTLFKARSQYFKEIQVLSDTVRDPIFMDLEKSIQSTQKEEADYVSKVDELKRRLRYLLHLQMVQSTDELNDNVKSCYICTEPIETGILTNKCGHVCCEDCWKEWQAQGHRTCVMCQTRVLPTEVHRIIYAKTRTSAQDGQVASSTAENCDGTAATNEDSGNTDPLAVRYHELDDSLRVTLNNLPTQGRFGSKIDHVVKHVRYIINRTGEKSLIFSSFGRGLDVVAQALTANGIRFVRLASAGKVGSEAAKIFRSDPDVHVMLLHSEVQSSGLNLLAASHIHILEPLLNTSLELQAIGRVHRIGQTKETNIWCYYVKDTVEERILALSAYKSQNLYFQGRDTSLTDGPTTLESSSRGNAAEHSKQDAKKWSAFGKRVFGGAVGGMRGDATSDSTELLACYFARYLPLTGQKP